MSETPALGQAMPHAGLLALMDELDHLLRSEEELLTQGQHQAQHGELVARKQHLMMRYQQALHALAQEPQRLKNLSDSEKAALRRAGMRLEESTARNMKLLKQEIGVSDLLLRTMVDALRKEQTRAPSAGSYGGQPVVAEAHESVQPMLVRKKI